MKKLNIFQLTYWYILVFVFEFIFKPEKILQLGPVPVYIWTGKTAEWRFKYFHHDYAAITRVGRKKWVSINATSMQHLLWCCIFHEIGHIICPAARRPESFTGKASEAHQGKGMRFEHQADAYAIRATFRAFKDKAPIHIKLFMDYLSKASGDGPYRSKLIRRYVRRYYRINL